MKKIRKTFAEIRPDLVKNWLPENELRPQECPVGSSKVILWECSKGHRFYKSPRRINRTKKEGCGYCSGHKIGYGNDLDTYCRIKGMDILLNEWSPKNDLTPKKVTPHTLKKVWWICGICGHEWQAIIRNRVYGRGCPKCGAIKPHDFGERVRIGKFTKEKSLAREFPEVTKEWHPTKNGKRRPENVTSGSGLKVWWRCSRGHEWPAVISSRTNLRAGCPFCHSQSSETEFRLYSEIKRLFYPLRVLFRYRKNTKYEIDIYIPKLRLGIEVDGGFFHSDKMDADREKNIYYNNIGIKILRLRDKSLARISPDDVIYEHSNSKDGQFEIISSLLSSRAMTGAVSSIPWLQDRIKIYLCEKNFINEEHFLIHWLKAHPEDNITINPPAFMTEWVKELNPDPALFTKGSNFKAKWRCSRCGRIYNTSVKQRFNRGSGCPDCYRKNKSRILREAFLKKRGSFAQRYPDLVEEWDQKKNRVGPDEVTPGSGDLVWWKCRVCQHGWKTSPNGRARGRGCPACSKRNRSEAVRKAKFNPEESLAKLSPRVAAEWISEKNPVGPDEIANQSNKVVWWRCGECGKEWKQKIQSRTFKGDKSLCSECRNKNRSARARRARFNPEMS